MRSQPGLFPGSQKESAIYHRILIQKIQVLGPAHRILSLAETVESNDKAFLLRFIDWIANTQPTLDVLTIQLRFDNPYEIAVAADNVRRYMDKVGLSFLPIWIRP